MCMGEFDIRGFSHHQGSSTRSSRLCHHIIPNHTALHHTIPGPNHIISYHIISYHNISYHTILYRTGPYHTTLYYVAPGYDILCSSRLRHQIADRSASPFSPATLLTFSSNPFCSIHFLLTHESPGS